jgi:phosphate starvation-inducible protein PhoH
MNNFTIVNKTSALLAKRNSGKSVLLKHLVNAEKHKFARVFVICPTEKINRFYSDIVNDLCGRGDAYQILQSKGMIKFMTSSFVRGLTFDNSVIIVDECQSMTYHELDTIITRVGESSKIIFCGDTRQDDLQQSKNRADVSGLGAFLKVLKNIHSFETIQFTPEDIVRSGLVKEYILAKEAYLQLS